MNVTGFEACVENIGYLNRKYEKISHCIKVHVSEAVRIGAKGLRFEDIISDTDSAIEKLNTAIKGMSSEFGYPETLLRLLFCKSLADTVSMPSAKALCKMISPIEETVSEQTVISCLRGKMSDEAYGRFSVAFDNARIRYADTFSTVCENVYHSVCDFAVMPHENSDDGILQGFSNLIDKYELYTVGSVELENENDFGTTSYALLAKNPMIINVGGKMRVSVKMTQERNYTPRLFAIGEYFSAQLLQIHSVSLSDKRNRTQCVFELSDDNPCPLVLALLLNIPGIEVRGIYRAN